MLCTVSHKAIQTKTTVGLRCSHISTVILTVFKKKKKARKKYGRRKRGRMGRERRERKEERREGRIIQAELSPENPGGFLM